MKISEDHTIFQYLEYSIDQLKYYTYWKKIASKSTWGEQPVEDIPIFTCKYVGLLICTGAPGQTKKDTDLKFGTRTFLEHIQNIFCLFEKLTLRGARFEKLP